MNVIKWVGVVVLSVILWFSGSMTGIAFSVDRSFGNTEFVSGLIFRQDLAGLFGAVKKSEGGESVSFSSATLALLDPEIKKQTKPMLDRFYDYLKAKKNEPGLAIDLNQYKQDPQLPAAAAKLLKGNATLKYLPDGFGESAARLLIDKLPEQIDLIKIFEIRDSDLVYARSFVASFYRYYAMAAWTSLIMAALIVLLLRDARQSAIVLGVVILVVALTLFIPYLTSESMIGKAILGGKSPAPEIVKKFAATMMREFFAVYVTTPLILGIAGLGSVAAGVFVFRRRAKE